MAGWRDELMADAIDGACFEAMLNEAMGMGPDPDDDATQAGTDDDADDDEAN